MTLPPLIVAGAVPVEVTVRLFADSDPTATCPKLRLLALAESEGAVVAIPFPCIGILADAFVVELLDTVMLPVASPSAAGLNFTFSAICWFGCSTWGSVIGGPENDPPATAMELIVTAAEPFETSVMVFDPEEPTVTSPKSTLAGTDREADVVPVPVRLIEFGLPVALSVSVTSPFWAPPADGAKVSGSATRCPGARVSGSCIVPAENASPLTASDWITTAAVPLDVNVTEFEPCEPAATEPKSTAVLLNVRAGVFGGAGADVVPVPVRLMAFGLPVALSVSVISPCSVPAADGAKVSGRAICWPGARVNGNCNFPAENPLPLTCRFWSTTAALPLEVKVTDLEPCEPTITEPKSIEVLLKVRAGVSAEVGRRLRRRLSRRSPSTAS